MTGRFMGSIRKKPLCKKTTTCTTTSLWVYPLSNNATKHRSYDKRDFQPNIILDEIKNILRDPKMKYRNSTFLINLGIHYTLSINFTTYQKLIDEVLVILRNRKELGSNAKIVWKTITTIRKELEKPNGNSMTWRFISEPVVFMIRGVSTYQILLLLPFLHCLTLFKRFSQNQDRPHEAIYCQVIFEKSRFFLRAFGAFTP